MDGVISGAEIMACQETVRKVLVPDHVMDFVAKSLPGYMLPRAMFVLDELPKTGSGKISRRRLAEMLATTAAIDGVDGGLVR